MKYSDLLLPHPHFCCFFHAAQFKKVWKHPCLQLVSLILQLIPSRESSIFRCLFNFQ